MTVNQPDGSGAARHIFPRANQTYMAMVIGGVLSALFMQGSHRANRQQHTHTHFDFLCTIWNVKSSIKYVHYQYNVSTSIKFVLQHL